MNKRKNNFFSLLETLSMFYVSLIKASEPSLTTQNLTHQHTNNFLGGMMFELKHCTTIEDLNAYMSVYNACSEFLSEFDKVKQTIDEKKQEGEKKIDTLSNQNKREINLNANLKLEKYQIFLTRSSRRWIEENKRQQMIENHNTAMSIYNQIFAEICENLEKNFETSKLFTFLKKINDQNENIYMNDALYTDLESVKSNIFEIKQMVPHKSAIETTGIRPGALLEGKKYKYYFNCLGKEDEEELKDMYKELSITTKSILDNHLNKIEYQIDGQVIDGFIGYLNSEFRLDIENIKPENGKTLKSTNIEFCVKYYSSYFENKYESSMNLKASDLSKFIKNLNKVATKFCETADDKELDPVEDFNKFKEIMEGFNAARENRDKLLNEIKNNFKKDFKAIVKEKVEDFIKKNGNMGQSKIVKLFVTNYNQN